MAIIRLNVNGRPQSVDVDPSAEAKADTVAPRLIATAIV